jgi:hypothetical protein
MVAVTSVPELESLPWTAAVTRMDWVQGEHVTLIGPTGAGKTELLIELVRPLPWVIFLSTKRIDRTLAPLREMGYRTIRSGKELNPEVDRRFIVAPPWSPKLTAKQQNLFHRNVFDNVLNRAFRQTGWTVVIDELEYINRDLKIEESLDRLYRQGRSQGNSIFAGTQRPRNVTLHAYEQATHLFIWRQSDLTNIVRAAELTGISKQDVIQVVRSLDQHTVFYVNTITGERFLTNTRWE